MAESEHDLPDVRRADRSGSGIFVGLMLLSPLLYVLSIGPVACLAEHDLLPDEPIRAFYAPVVWLHDHTPLEKPLEWYGSIWGWR